MNTYYKYEKEEKSLGIISSNNSNIIYCECIEIEKKKYKNCIICGALEKIYIWDIKSSKLIKIFIGNESIITYIICKNNKIVNGNNDGEIKVWNIIDLSNISLKGHNGKITCLSFDSDINRLISGSIDKYIIIWDLINECGLYKLKGHNGPITKVEFLDKYNMAISSSCDTFIKIWDLDTQHCFATLLGHDSEIWDFQLLPDEIGLICTTSSDEYKIWRFEYIDNYENRKRKEKILKDIPLKCISIPSLLKKNSSRTKSLIIHKSGRILVSLNKNSSIDFYNICNMDSESSDIFKYIGSYKSINNQIQHISLGYYNHNNYSLIICIQFKNNFLSLCDFNLSNCNITMNNLYTISKEGHRNAPTYVCLNSNNMYFATSSNDCIKIWSIYHKTSIHTYNINLCTCICFTLGDRYILCGTEDGKLILYDATNSNIVERVNAHDKKIWDVKMNKNTGELASCSGDKFVKFWMICDGKLEETRNLEMSDDCLTLVYSYDNKYIAISLIDCNIKIFFQDTLKYFITLYGHKLPVNTIDISYDSELLATGSGDKNIKIWGTSFGDCRKSIFAHDSSINDIKFINNTHYFISCSDDHTIKFWDADTFQMIFTMKGHFDKVTKLALSDDGALFISVSLDNSIQVWQRNDDELVVQENEYDNYDSNTYIPPMNCSVKKVENEVQSVLKCTEQHLKISDDLIEAIDIAEIEDSNNSEIDHPILSALKMTPSEYVLYILSRISSNDLEVSLISLPYKYAIRMLNLILVWLEESLNVELNCRCACYLVELHFYQIVNSPSHKELLKKLSLKCKEKLTCIKDTLGINMAGMEYLKKELDNNRCE